MPRAGKVVSHGLPWLITAGALYYAFQGIDWQTLVAHIGEADIFWLSLAVCLTISSYLLRSRRWIVLFPEHVLDFWNAVRVLFLGFFMNNILPARAGEFVRAHMGARLARQTRTLVLATIASERLVDGITISLMYILFAFGIGDSSLSDDFFVVAGIFAAAGTMVVLLLFTREHVFRLADKISSSFNHKASSYALDKLKLFINGLSPLTCSFRLPKIIAWSIVVWSVELIVYKCVTLALSSDLSFSQCVLFLVAVNFSSLIPAAPGGIGVIEAVGKWALVSMGVSPELALTMVIAQHAVQYLVVGLPGAVIMLNWKKILDQVRQEEDYDQSSTAIKF